MDLWNFTHKSLNMDVYAFLSLLIIFAMVIIGVLFMINQRKRDEKHDEELCSIRAELSEARNLDNNEEDFE